MKGYSLTRLRRAPPMDRSDKPLDMNDMKEKWGNSSSGTAGNQSGGNAPRGSISPSPAASMGGKDPTANPVGTPKARTFIEDGSKPPATTLPGSRKPFISEELTWKFRPGAASDGAPEKHVGNLPTGVGISRQWMEEEQ